MKPGLSAFTVHATGDIAFNEATIMEYHDKRHFYLTFGYVATWQENKLVMYFIWVSLILSKKTLSKCSHAEKAFT